MSRTGTFFVQVPVRDIKNTNLQTGVVGLCQVECQSRSAMRQTVPNVELRPPADKIYRQEVLYVSNSP